MIFTPRTGGILKRLIHLHRRLDGSVTAEFVIWVPVLIILLAFTADACQLYLIQANVWYVARDAVRRMSVSELTANPDTVTPYATGQLIYNNTHYTITPSTTTSCTNSVKTINDIVSISLPVKYASIFGILEAYGNFGNTTLTAKVTMLEEDSGAPC